MPRKPRTRIALELEPKLRRQLLAHAQREDLDISKLVRRVLRDFLNGSIPVRRPASPSG